LSISVVRFLVATLYRIVGRRLPAFVAENKGIIEPGGAFVTAVAALLLVRRKAARWERKTAEGQ
jgi:hypothetical protein